MQRLDAENAISRLFQLCREAHEVSRTATSNKKSLAGNNFYGQKFHKIVVELTAVELSLDQLLQGYPGAPNSLLPFTQALTTIKSTDSASRQKFDALKDIDIFCQTHLAHYIGSLTETILPKTEQILPLAVLQNAPEYYKRLVLQANGCYENGWYDASAVLLRKVLESLIIEVYFKLGRANDIKKDGDFLALEKLIDHISKDSALHLGRETKTDFPHLDGKTEELSGNLG